MANLRAIRKRIGSVKSTQQITKAMKMVSAAKLRRAQDAITAARPYARKLREVVQALSGRAGADAHPLLTSREEVRRLGLLVVTSDRGLCGSFNSGLLRTVQRFLREDGAGYEEVVIHVVGRKGRDFFRRRDVRIEKDYVGVLGQLSYANAEIMAHDLVEAFTEARVDEVRIVFNEFRSPISQIPRFERLFPIAVEEGGAVAEGAPDIDYLYEPSRNEILATLLPKYVEMQIFRSLLESVAGEHGARMSAMDSATRNAKEMISSLTLQMNRARQAAITKELSEIVSGAESLKG
jgi:F-type H+-transporting ATPase subunit gamma